MQQTASPLFVSDQFVLGSCETKGANELSVVLCASSKLTDSIFYALNVTATSGSAGPVVEGAVKVTMCRCYLRAHPVASVNVCVVQKVVA